VSGIIGGGRFVGGGRNIGQVRLDYHGVGHLRLGRGLGVGFGRGGGELREPAAEEVEMGNFSSLSSKDESSAGDESAVAPVEAGR